MKLLKHSDFFQTYKIRKHEKLNKISNNIKNKFSNIKHINSLSAQDFFKYVEDGQKLINEENFAKIFIDNNIKVISKLINLKKLYFTPQAYLRAIRNNTNQQEYIEFHRESFYNEFNKNCYSIWVPLVKITKNNCLKYVAEEKDSINNKFKNNKNPIVRKNSSGHKIGLNYNKFDVDVNPKKIKNMILKINEFLVFDGNLLHGNGSNRENYVRLAINFFIIPSNKKINYYRSASKKELYYVKY